MFRRSIFNVSLDTFLCNLRKKSHSGSRQQGFACIMCYSSKAEPALLIEVRWRIRRDKAHISTLSDCSWQFKSLEKYMVRIKTFLPVWKPNKHFSVMFPPFSFIIQIPFYLPIQPRGLSTARFQYRGLHLSHRVPSTFARQRQEPWNNR